MAPQTEALLRQREQTNNDLNLYLAGLVERHRKQPEDDLLSRMVTDTGPEGRMPDHYLVGFAMLLLVAGPETTMDLIGNGMLTLLRHPAILQRLRNAPDLIPAFVEEILRYDPPVQFLLFRTIQDEIALAGTTIPEGCGAHAGPSRGQP